MKNNDDYKHVCWKDLKQYLNVSNFLLFLKTSSKLYIQELRAVLGIKDITVDKNLNDKSTNPVENKAITCKLNNKVDKSELNRAAFTGSYKDLSSVPTSIPNPYGLILKDINSSKQTYYDGTKPVEIEIPDSNNINQKFDEINKSIQNSSTDLNKQIADLQQSLSQAALTSDVNAEQARALTAEGKLNAKIDKVIAALTAYASKYMTDEQKTAFMNSLK